MGEQLTGSQILCRALLAEGVDLLFGYPGGAIMPFYHALPEYPGLRHVLVRHEQAAAHAADGYARASGRPGVCVATSGPGATNLVTGIATAHMDNSPLVAITGQVPRAMIGRDAFQETDIIGITQPITKHSRLVEDVGSWRKRCRRRSRWRARGGRARCCSTCPRTCRARRWNTRTPVPRRGRVRAGRWGRPRPWPLVEAAAPDRRRAERPLIMAGHGVILSERLRRAARPGRAHRHPGHHHAAGHQRDSRVAPPASRHARDARRGARQPGHPAGRPHHRRGSPVR